MLRSIGIRVMLAALMTAVLSAAQEARAPEDPLAPLQRLEGVWQGEGQGFGQTSIVTHAWERVLDGKFLRLTTRSVGKSRDGAESVHEDVGYVSWSEDERVLRFRQFLNEGYVNTFRVVPAGKPEEGFDFEPEATEGAGDMAARMTLRFEPKGGYVMILELGRKGKPLKACQTMKLRK